MMSDLISRQEAIDAVHQEFDECLVWDESGQTTADEVERILDYLPSAEPRWIPVTERLPEEGTAVNITWVNHSPVIYYQHLKDKPQTATGVYYRRKWYWWSAVVQDYLAEYGEWEFDEMADAIEVTHWMPLPEPPMGERKEDDAEQV